MQLIIDIGNTRAKVAVFEKSECIEKQVVTNDLFDTFVLTSFIEKYAIERIILSNSGNISSDIVTFLAQQKYFVWLNADTPLPIQNQYTTPQTLGKDRLAGVVAAANLFSKQNCLTIDCGTCLTYNFINANGVFLGGNITPGIKMRLKAMHHFTAKLPLLEQGEISSLVGNDTASALRTGAQLGVPFEIGGFWAAYEAKYGKVQLILTGGDASYVLPYLEKYQAIWVEDLVLIGLNAILNFQSKTN